MAKVNLGRVGFVMQGNHSTSKTYKRLDCVTSNGVMYSAKEDVPTGIAINNETYWQKIFDGEEVMDSKMERYVIKLTKNGETYSLTDIDNQAVTFNSLYNTLRDLSKYVVCVYGNSKLRPQYVSTNEMLFIGLDRASSNSKVLRMHVLPNAVQYETFELAEKSYVDTELNKKASASTMAAFAKNLGDLEGDVDELKNDIAQYDDAFIGTPSGKNLYNKNAVNHVDGKMLNGSTLNPLYDYNIYAYSGEIEVKPNTQYTFSTSGRIIRAVFIGNNTVLGDTRPASTVVTFTTPDGCDHVAFNLFGATHTTEDYEAAINSAQLELGATATPYEPYGSETKVLRFSRLEGHEKLENAVYTVNGVEPVDGNVELTIESDVDDAFYAVPSKNIYDKETAESADGYMVSGTTLRPLYAYPIYAYSGEMPVQPSTQYTFSCSQKIIKIIYVNGSSVIEGVMTGGVYAYTFTTPANCTHVGFNLIAANHTAADYQAALDTAQLELGDKATEYEPHTSGVKNLKITRLEKGETLDGITTVAEKAKGKNLYDKTLAVDGSYVYTNGSIVRDTAAYTGLIPVQPNTQYTFSVDEAYNNVVANNILQFRADKSYAGNQHSVASNTAALSFITPDDVRYVAFNMFLGKAHTAEELAAVVDTAMLEQKAGRSKVYVPYEESVQVKRDSIMGVPWIGMFDQSAKHWCSVGTSITRYNCNLYESGSLAGKLCRGYQSHITEALGMKLTNVGVSGSTLANVNASSFINRVQSIDWTQFDVVTIEYGVNDFGYDVVVGSPDSAASTSDFCGCYKTVLDYIIGQNPNVRIIICTEPDVRGLGPNRNGNTLKDYTDATIAIAKQYRLDVCDWYYTSGITDTTRGNRDVDYLTIDGTHPNDKGHERMGKMLMKHMIFG